MTSPRYKGLLLATKNPAKEKKLRWLLDGLGLPLVAAPRWALDALAVVEEGETHLENAERKARMWSRMTAGMMTVSTDGGLLIPSLGERWDALHTDRFAGDGATDRDRLDRLLEMMEPYTGDQRAARWVEALAVARLGRVLGSWRVESQPGILANEYDPSNIQPGFWAFSIWYLPQFNKSYNELSDGELEGLEDHWGRLRTLVREFFKQLDFPV